MQQSHLPLTNGWCMKRIKQSKPMRARRAWISSRSSDFEKDLEGQPVQDLESDVIGKLLSAAGQSGRHSEEEWRGAHFGCSNCRRSRGTDGGQAGDRARDRSNVSPGFVRLSARKIGAGCRGRSRGNDAGSTIGFLEFDIKGLFDNIDHALLQKAVEKHVKCEWAMLYIGRWLTAPLATAGRNSRGTYAGDAPGRCGQPDLGQSIPPLHV